MANKTPMTPEAASRIQSHADRTGTNQDFKERAQSAGDRNRDASEQEHGSGGPGGSVSADQGAGTKK